MQKAKIGGVTGIAVGSNFDDVTERREVFDLVSHIDKNTRVVFLAFRPSKYLTWLIEFANINATVVKFVTNERSSYTKFLIEILRGRLVMASEQEEFVSFGEWDKNKINIVVFPDSQEGMSLFVRGCGQIEGQYQPKIMKSGEIVFDRKDSHLHNEAASILPEAISRIESRERQFIVEEVGFGQLIGKTICIETGPDDQIAYAQRRNRRGLSRFVLNREAAECDSCVVILKKAADLGGYVLITAFIGHLSAPEPWDKNNFAQQANPAEAEQKSRDFWASHALVWGSEDTIPGTETTECPW